ncbi:hypothetical protein RFI_26210, partial [Reticulomyxa filosa]
MTMTSCITQLLMSDDDDKFLDALLQDLQVYNICVNLLAFPILYEILYIIHSLSEPSDNTLPCGQDFEHAIESSVNDPFGVIDARENKDPIGIADAIAVGGARRSRISNAGISAARSSVIAMNKDKDKDKDKDKEKQGGTSILQQRMETQMCALCGYIVWVNWCDMAQFHGYYKCIGFRNDHFAFVHKRDDRAQLIADQKGFWYLIYDDTIMYKSSGSFYPSH